MKSNVEYIRDAIHFGQVRCENCGKKIQDGQPFKVYKDGIVHHKECPK